MDFPSLSDFHQEEDEFKGYGSQKATQRERIRLDMCFLKEFQHEEGNQTNGKGNQTNGKGNQENSEKNWFQFPIHFKTLLRKTTI